MSPIFCLLLYFHFIHSNRLASSFHSQFGEWEVPRLELTNRKKEKKSRQTKNFSACRWHSSFLFKNEKPSLCDVFLSSKQHKQCTVCTLSISFQICCLWFIFLFRFCCLLAFSIARTPTQFSGEYFCKVIVEQPSDN